MNIESESWSRKSLGTEERPVCRGVRKDIPYNLPMKSPFAIDFDLAMQGLEVRINSGA